MNGLSFSADMLCKYVRYAVIEEANKFFGAVDKLPRLYPGLARLTILLTWIDLDEAASIANYLSTIKLVDFTDHRCYKQTSERHPYLARFPQ